MHENKWTGLKGGFYPEKIKRKKRRFKTTFFYRN